LYNYRRLLRVNITRKSVIKIGSVGIAILLITALLVVFVPARVNVTGEGRLSVTFDYKVYASPGWVSPTGNISGTGWVDGNLAWDDDTGTYASCSIAGVAWSDNIQLTHAAIRCDKVQIWSSRSSSKIDQIAVDVYYNNSWNNIYTGSLTVDSFVEYAIGSVQTVTAMQVRYYESQAGKTYDAYLNEADFNEVVPDILNTPTSVDFLTVSANTSYWSFNLRHILCKRDHNTRIRFRSHGYSHG